MQFLKTENLIADLLFGIVFSLIGGFFILRRKALISALLFSSKVFWEKMNFHPDEGRSALLANIMIPIIGVCFLLIGLLLLYRVVVYFLK